MPEKKHPEKIKSAALLEKVTTEILAANGRSIEPFIKVFSYSGENITASSLGTLVGVFEVAERGEDSAYIVNFLASVAKKEYFNNPRRGAIESFEAALHKINLALAELVKHGNIAWLGKLHGALGVLEKDNLHFSITGKAKILLLRNGNFSEISEGLASEESSLHPIKTFVEVSSGRLMPHDKIVLTSPELFTLLSLEDLEKNALRMDSERFAQFLRTALINELDMAGAIIIDISKSKPVVLPKKQETRPTETAYNVFSQKAFVPQTKREEIDSEEQVNKNKQVLPSEYIDSKTGHIYVQGNTPEGSPTHPSLEYIQLFLQDIGHRIGGFFASQEKFLRKGKKQSFLFFDASMEQSRVVTRKASRFLRKQLRNSLSRVRSKIASLQLPKTSKEEPVLNHEPIMPRPALVKKKEETLVSTDARDTADIPPFLRERLTAFYRKNNLPESQVSPKEFSVENFQKNICSQFRSVQEVLQKGYVHLRSLRRRRISQARIFFKRSLFLVKNLPPHHQKIFLIGSSLVFIVLVAGIFFLTRQSKENPLSSIEATPPEQTKASVFPFDTEKNAHLLEVPVTLATEEGTLIDSVLLGNETYLITEKNIIGINDKQRYTLPNNGSARLAAPMDHLSLIFIYTDTGELFAWSPISRTFVKNTLALPEGTVVRDIGTYLTYLYVLDGTTNQIYRFPRAEGGFGQSTAWIRDALTIEDAAKMSVNETIFIAPDKNTVQAFFRGHFVKNLESPNIPLSMTSLFTHPGLANVYALDTENKRILVWNQDGALIAQYFSEKLADARTITVNEKTSEALITTSNMLLSFKIEK